MSFLVQKFGGTSVGDLDRIRDVAAKIKAARDADHRLVVVVSAMGGETDRLTDLARSITGTPNPRELDVLLSTGDRIGFGGGEARAGSDDQTGVYAGQAPSFPVPSWAYRPPKPDTSHFGSARLNAATSSAVRARP